MHIVSQANPPLAYSASCNNGGMYVLHPTRVRATITPLHQARQQRSLDRTIRRLSYQEAAELAAEGAWVPRGSSQRIPLVPQPISWLLYEAAREMANASSGGTPFDVDKAVTLARYTSVVYCNESNIWQWNCTRCRRAGPMTVYGVVFDPVWDLKAYAGYSRTLGAKMIVFRGTDSHSLYNWVENMRYWRTDVSVPFPNATGVLVHTGFLASYNMSTLRANLTAAMARLNQWHPFAPTYVVGHSLGGALATLCALDMKFTFGLRDVRVYTFGSPRVGNQQFAQYFDKHVPVRGSSSSGSSGGSGIGNSGSGTVL